MDRCNNIFRLVISNMVLRLPLSGAMQSNPSIFCKIFFNKRSCKILDIPSFFSNGRDEPATLLLNKPCAIFDLSDAEMSRLSRSKKSINLTFELHSRSDGGPSCGFSTNRLLGTVTLPLDLSPVRHDQETRFHNGWLDRDHKKTKKDNRLGVSSPQLHVSVRVEPDSRLSFQFTGSPRGNVEILHVHGSIREPVFTSTFTWGPAGPEANLVQVKKSKSRRKVVQLRSGWSVTIRDMSGSPVAVASMVVPYVAEMQPVAWLIEQLGDDDKWVPWGRLAAWHERPHQCVHIRFEKGTDADAQPVEWSVNLNQGGTVSIDYRESGKGGFVVSASVGGEGSRVEVSTKHVKCAKDAASYLALAAAVNLSVDACRRFM